MLGDVVIAKRETSGKYWYHRDHVDSVRLITNSSGAAVRKQEFAPYGKMFYSWTSGSNVDHLTFGSSPFFPVKAERHNLHVPVSMVQPSRI
jgi:hypothetical protein